MLIFIFYLLKLMYKCVCVFYFKYISDFILFIFEFYGDILYIKNIQRILRNVVVKLVFKRVFQNDILILKFFFKNVFNDFFIMKNVVFYDLSVK